MSAFDADVSAAPAHRAAKPDAASLGLGFAALIAVAGLYALEHPWPGVIGDSKIYMGRALADLDPAGVGADLMFRLDGQSQFSLFTPAARWLLAHLQLVTAAALIAATGGALWFSGALAFARQAAPGSALAVAAIVFAAPAFYGPYKLLSYAEPLAEPRPFAEAFTLLALAVFLSGRLIPALALLGVAAAIHPIMALAGVAAIGLTLCLEDRRWLLLAFGGALALAAAVAIDAPIAGRLRVLVDPQWLALLMDRNAYLFPRFWKPDDLVLPAVQTVTILLAAARCQGRLKHLLYAGLAAGLLGVLVAWVSDAVVPSLLLLQAQTWRMWWLTGCLSAFALALLAIRYGTGASREKFALAMLAFAWTMWSQGPIVFVALALAIFLATPRFARDLAISGKIAGWTWAALAAAVVVPALAMLVEWMKLPATEGFAPIFTKRLLAVAGDAILLATIALAARGLPQAVARIPRAALLAAALVAAGLGAWLWRDPDSYAREIAAARVQQELVALTPRAGEILWLQGSLEPWIWLHRPHWLGDIQGAGIVFSRELAMLYRERAEALGRAGLDNGGLIRRYADLPKTFMPPLDRAGVARICGRADGPAYIVAPLARDDSVDPGLGARLWKAPALRLESSVRNEIVETVSIRDYAVIDCAPLR